MAKLTINKINKENLNTGITKNDLINEIKDLKKDNELKDNEIESLKSQIISSQSGTDLISLTSNIKNNDNLNIQDKTELFKIILEKYQTQYFNISDNIEILENEINFLLNDIKDYSGLTQISFILIAKRLQKIKNNPELFSKRGYKTFQDYFINVLKIPKSSGYIYLNIIDLFKELFNQSNRLDYNLEYSKLIPFLTLLNSDRLNEKEKQEIKNNAIKLLSEDKNKREIINIAKDLKLKYGLIQEKQDNDFDKLIERFIKKLPKDLTDKDKENIINKIKERFNQ